MDSIEASNNAMLHLPKTLNVQPKVKLSIPLVASYLSKDYNQRDIARACNVSDAWVSEYISKHYKQLAPLLDTTDGLAAFKNKHLANKAQDRINIHLNETTKKDLIALNAISGTHTDKYLALSGKAPIESGKLVFNVVFNNPNDTPEPTVINVTPPTGGGKGD